MSARGIKIFTPRFYLRPASVCLPHLDSLSEPGEQTFAAGVSLYLLCQQQLGENLSEGVGRISVQLLKYRCCTAKLDWSRMVFHWQHL